MIVSEQRAAAGQVGSPPPLTVAVLLTLGCAAEVGVTGITNAVDAPTARPAEMEQVTTCPADEQPAGIVPRVRPAGIVSLTVEVAVVAVAPVLVTVSVKEAGMPTVQGIALAVLTMVSSGSPKTMQLAPSDELLLVGSGGAAPMIDVGEELTGSAANAAPKEKVTSESCEVAFS